MKTYDSLTQACFSQFANRKRAGRLSVLVDTHTDLVYAVPLAQEHIDFARQLLGYPESLDAYELLVPSHVDFDPSETIQYVLTGVCGLEIGLGVRHSREQLQRAHDRTLAFVYDGEFAVSDPLEHQVLYKYAK